MCGKRSKLLLLGLLFFILLVNQNSVLAQKISAGKPSAEKQLHALFEDEWEWSMRQNPTWASHLGDLRYNDRWSDESFEAITLRQRHRRAVIEKLSQIDVAELSASDTINFTLFLREYRMAHEGDRHQWYLLPLTMRGGIQDAGSTADSLRFKTIKDYQDWIARMQAFPVYMDQTLELMKAGIRQKRMHPKVVMKRVPSQIRRQIVEDPKQSLFFKPFRNFPEAISTEDRNRLLQDANDAITNKIVPAYRKMLTFFEQEYLPACFDRVGVWQMTKGQELYAFRARKFTTTELTPKQIHEIGLKEVPPHSGRDGQGHQPGRIQRNLSGIPR
jgi:uncharacterized protein (DUF885 family)